MNSQPGQLLAPNRRRSISDPLSAALLPPPNESPEERERRLSAEAEAKKRSDNIDKMLREGERQNRRKKVVKVLLLGQSESGKSTTLKRESKLHLCSYRKRFRPPCTLKNRIPNMSDDVCDRCGACHLCLTT